MADKFGNQARLDFVCSRAVMRACDLLPEMAVKKLEAFRIAKAIGGGGVVVLSREELNMIRFCVMRICKTEIAGPALELLGGV